MDDKLLYNFFNSQKRLEKYQDVHFNTLDQIGRYYYIHI